jgi:hypothetical protein
VFSGSRRPTGRWVRLSWSSRSTPGDYPCNPYGTQNGVRTTRESRAFRPEISVDHDPTSRNPYGTQYAARMTRESRAFRLEISMDHDQGHLQSTETSWPPLPAILGKKEDSGTTC